MHLLQLRKYNIFIYRQVFDKRISLRIFLHGTFHVRVMQRKPESILNTVPNVYPHIDFMNKVMSIVQKLHVQCDSSQEIWFEINSR